MELVAPVRPRLLCGSWELPTVSEGCRGGGRSSTSCSFNSASCLRPSLGKGARGSSVPEILADAPGVTVVWW